MNSKPLKSPFFVLWLFVFLGVQTTIAAEIKVLVLGDSLTEGYGVEKEEAYPSLLQQMLTQKGHKDVQIINAGISGSTSASAVSRLRWYRKIKPNILLLALGANDGLRGLSVEKMKTNLAEAIVMAKKQDILVLLAGMKIPLNYGDEYIKSFENIFLELAEAHKIPLIPFLLEGVGGHPA